MTLPGIVDIDQIVLVGRQEPITGGEEHVLTRRIRREEVGIIRTMPGRNQRHTTTITLTTTHTIRNAFIDIFDMTVGITRRKGVLTVEEQFTDITQIKRLRLRFQTAWMGRVRVSIVWLCGASPVGLHDGQLNVPETES